MLDFRDDIILTLLSVVVKVTEQMYTFSSVCPSKSECCWSLKRDDKGGNLIIFSLTYMYAFHDTGQKVQFNNHLNTIKQPDHQSI